MTSLDFSGCLPKCISTVVYVTPQRERCSPLLTQCTKLDQEEGQGKVCFLAKLICHVQNADGIRKLLQVYKHTRNRGVHDPVLF